MRAPFSYVPMLLPLAGVVTGIILAYSVGVVPVAVSAGIAFIIAFMLRRSQLFIITGFVAAGAVSFAANIPDTAFPQLESGSCLVGEIESADGTENGLMLTLRVYGIILPGGNAPDFDTDYRIKAYITGNRSDLLPGASIRLRKWIRLEDGQVPLPGDVDYGRYRKQKFISATVLSAEEQIETAGSGNPVRLWFAGKRTQFVRHIESAGLGPETTGFLIAVLAGDTDQISDSERRTFTAAGLVHVLALSGAHIAIIAFIAGIMLFPLRLAGLRIVYQLAVIAALWFYAFLTDMPYSVMRAVIMATFVGLAFVFRKPQYSLNTLLLAAFIILVFSPDALFSLSFQLSFCSVASILVILPSVAPLMLRSKWMYFLAAGLLMPVAAVCGSAPVLITGLGVFAPYFLLLALPGQLMVPVIMGGGIILVILGSFGVRCEWGCSAIDSLYALMTDMMESVSRLPYSVVEFAEVPLSATILLVLFALFFMLAIRSYRHLWGALCALSFAGACCSFISCGIPSEGETFRVVTENRTTYIAHHKGDTLYVANTDADEERRNINVRRFAALHNGYIRQNRIRNVNVIHDWNGTVRKDGVTVHFLFGENYPMPELDIDTLFVCRGYTGDLAGAIREISPKNVVLMPTLTPRRFAGYSAELGEQ